MLHICHHCPTWTPPLLVGPQKQEAAAGEGKGILMQGRNVLLKGEWERAASSPVVDVQNCSATELTVGGKRGLENTRWIRREAGEPTALGILHFWTCAKPRSTVLVSLSSRTFTLGRDPRTIRQKEWYLNAKLNATSLLRNLPTVSRVVHWQGCSGHCQWLPLLGREPVLMPLNWAASRTWTVP